MLTGASAQIRNMATTAGNLLQRTRCIYFRDTVMPCNKREPGSGCSAIDGCNRNLAILGTSEQCIATNPSDMSVAMAALEATIHVHGGNGERAMPISDFHLLPGNTPQRETVLEPGELITHVTIAPPAPGNRASTSSSRPRFVRICIGLRSGRDQAANGRIDSRADRARRSRHEAMALHRGRRRTGRPARERRGFPAAAEAALRGARPQSQNGFKVELAKRCLVHALKPGPQPA